MGMYDSQESDPDSLLTHAYLQQLDRPDDCRHLLLLFDSCYSGNVFSRGDVDVEPIISQSAIQCISGPRSVITEDPVAGHGFLTQSLLRGLGGEAWQDQSDFITAEHLGFYVQQDMGKKRGPVESSLYGHVSEVGAGQMIFARPKVLGPAAAAAV
eukprot:NODE_1056_length_684_cov_364.223622_g823_i0.p1 GENE.NODE_1056_length_684_cov_364.223622_g823_i0~~NODE_1056_length_684_cov_364.223622_g823_i0.p1  ORF type:complete len:166 (+),score=35.96 NODE_1056_length_684_cov_364.223622_g823_i0:34-498(+)